MYEESRSKGGYIILSMYKDKQIEVQYRSQKKLWVQLFMFTIVCRELNVHNFEKIFLREEISLKNIFSNLKSLRINLKVQKHTR